MKRILTTAAALVAFLLLALAGFLVLSHTPPLDPDYLTAKYGGEKAHFAQMADGLSVHYRDEGNPRGPALILVHGSTSSLHTWEHWVAALGDEFRIISYDQPGHGLTGPDPQGDYTATAMIAALDAVADAAGVERFALAGNSMGGWVAWRYALARPGRVDALILLDPSGLPPEPGSPGPVGFALAASPLGRALVHVTPRWLIAETARQSVHVKEIVTPAYIDRYWELLRYPGNREATLDRLSAEREWEMAARLTEIEAPTLILWGAHDSLIDVADADVFAERIPDSRAIVYPDAGHLPMEEVPQESAEDTRAFLQEVLPRD